MGTLTDNPSGASFGKSAVTGKSLLSFGWLDGFQHIRWLGRSHYPIFPPPGSNSSIDENILGKGRKRTNRRKMAEGDFLRLGRPDMHETFFFSILLLGTRGRTHGGRNSPSHPPHPQLGRNRPKGTENVLSIPYASAAVRSSPLLAQKKLWTASKIVCSKKSQRGKEDCGEEEKGIERRRGEQERKKGAVCGKIEKEAADRNGGEGIVEEGER